jgi:hypothetical protein
LERRLPADSGRNALANGLVEGLVKGTEMDAALTVLVITLFFIVVLLLVLPEGLRLLAQRGAQQRRELEREAAGLGRELQEAANRLRPFRELTARVYQAHYGRAREELQQAVTSYQQALARLQALPRVSLPETGLAAPFFMRDVGLYSRAPRNWAWLKRSTAEMAAARTALAEAQKGIDELAQVPLTLRRQSHLLAAERLGRVQKDLEAEEAAGIAALADFAEQRRSLASEAEALQQLLQREPGAPLSQLNALALALEKVDEATATLEADVKEVQEARAALDRRRREVETARNRVQGAVDSDGPEAITGLIEEADNLLEEVDHLRPKRAFAGAETALGDALAYVQLANALHLAAAQVAALEAIADDVPDPEGALRLQGELDELLEAAEELTGAVEGERRPEAVARLRQQAERLQSTAGEVVARHRQLTAQLEGEADKAMAALATAWNRLQGTVAPLPGEMLAQRYQALQRQRRAAAGRPVLLEPFVGDATALTAEMKELTDYLQKNLQWAAEVRVELDELLGEAQGIAGEWRSLQPYFKVMQEETAAIFQMNPAGHGLAGAEETFNEMQTRYDRARDNYDNLIAERQRLYKVEERIILAQDTIQSRAAEMDETMLERAFELAQSYYAEARGAVTVDLAESSLQEVNRVLLDALE